MTGLRRKILWMPRLWLLTALLAAQSLVLAHGVEHALDTDRSLCAICSVSHGLDHAAAAPEAPAVPVAALPSAEVAGDSFIASAPSFIPPARGPPATL